MNTTGTLHYLSLAELSYLLWCTQGVKETKGQAATLRTVPSAGARHAFETYLLVNNVVQASGAPVTASRSGRGTRML